VLKYFVVLLFGLIAAGATIASASANTLSDPRPGAHSARISGYTVSNVSYVLNANPKLVDLTTFSLDAPAVNVRIRLEAGGPWYACRAISKTDWLCGTTEPQAVLGAVDTLEVVAQNQKGSKANRGIGIAVHSPLVLTAVSAAGYYQVL
jgi:hypothetical protein